MANLFPGQNPRFNNPSLNNVRVPLKSTFIGDNFSTGAMGHLPDNRLVHLHDGTTDMRDADNTNLIYYATHESEEAKRKESGEKCDGLFGMMGEEYINTVRFRPPPENWTYTWAGQQARFIICELLATTLFLSIVYLTQANINLVYDKFGPTPIAPLRVDLFFLAVIKGTAAFMISYHFWNWGKPLYNPAIIVTHWVVGHITFIQVLIRWAAQFVGACLAYGLVYTFTCSGDTVSTCIDPSVGVATVNLAGHNAGFHALWEFFGSTILAFVACWIYTSDKLYKEGISYIAFANHKAEKMKDNDITPQTKMDIETYGDGIFIANSPKFTRAIPAEYQQKSFSTNSFTIAVTFGVAQFILAYVGSIVTGGDGALNFFFWWPRVFDQSKTNGNLAISMAIQGSTYFFAPLAGALLAGALILILIALTKRLSFKVGVIDKAEVRLAVAQKQQEPPSAGNAEMKSSYFTPADDIEHRDNYPYTY